MKKWVQCSAIRLRQGRHVARRIDVRCYVSEGAGQAGDEADANGQLEQEPIYFSQDKDLVPEVMIKSLGQIKQETRTRFFKRYLVPSRKWEFSNTPCMEKSDGLKRSYEGWVKKELYDSERNGFLLSPQMLLESTLDIGDLCIVDRCPDQLTLCVELPTDPMDARYAFVKMDGSILYCTRSNVQLRLPAFQEKAARYLLSKEEKHGFQPIGTVKNTVTETFLMPIAARRAFLSYVPSEISRQAMEMLPVVSAKLELLHRYLQSHTGPWQISVFKLVQLVSKLALPTEAGTASQCMQNMFAELGMRADLFDVVHEVQTRVSTPQYLDTATYLATYWCILQQQKQQMWGKISYHRGIFAPVSVTVLPFKDQVLYYQKLVDSLTLDNYSKVDQVAKTINNGRNVKGLQQFEGIVRMLKDYSAGNFHNNSSITYLISRLFRRLKDYKDIDVTGDSCFRLLETLSENAPTNPFHWNHELELPASSARSSLNEEMYALAGPEVRGPQDHGVKRTSFDREICYCIDGETAHEIDDGVAIRPLGYDKYKLLVHIADPASLFSTAYNVSAEHDEILKTAFQRAFTTYLPDLVHTMLPESYCRASDLGQWGKPTKTMTFSVDVDLSKPRLTFIDPRTFRVELGVTTKSKRITYDYVDQVLRGTPATAEEKDLHTLYKVATRLRSSRVEDRNAIIFGSNKKGLVKLERASNGQLTDITFEDQKTSKSTLLVSELMIMTNSLAGNLFKRATIPGIFRGYNEPKLKFEAGSVYSHLKHSMKIGQEIANADATKALAFLTNSFYSSRPANHAMIGTKTYLTITSPLRRFPDLLNHLQLHRFLRNIPLCYSQRELDNINWHILARDIVIKDAYKHSSIFWTLKYLQRQLAQGVDNKWTVIVTSLPLNGFVNCRFPDYFYSPGRLKIDITTNKIPVTGNFVTNCQITKLSCLDGLLELSMTPQTQLS